MHHNCNTKKSAMKTYILLFRGINVGGNNLLSMKPLVELLNSCGYEQVKTYIQSGNVVLNSPHKPNNVISEKIESNFGFKPKLLVLNKTEFEQTIQNNPFGAAEGKTIHFFFLADEPTVDTEKLQRLATSTEKYQLIDRVFYLFAPDGIGRSKLAANVEKCMAVATTARNLNTVNKLLGMID
jgi:uncharacterized protein (DUF1697 family)